MPHATRSMTCAKTAALHRSLARLAIAENGEPFPWQAGTHEKRALDAKVRSEPAATVDRLATVRRCRCHFFEADHVAKCRSSSETSSSRSCPCLVGGTSDVTSELKR